MKLYPWLVDIGLGELLQMALLTTTKVEPGQAPL